MEMFAEIIRNMYGISLGEFAIMIIDSIVYLFASFLVFFSLFKIAKATESNNAKGALISVLGAIVSSFVSVNILESVETYGLFEMAVLLVPSIFTFVSAICFYRLSNELVKKYSQ